jgi:hypothetical protein
MSNIIFILPVRHCNKPDSSSTPFFFFFFFYPLIAAYTLTDFIAQPQEKWLKAWTQVKSVVL